MRSPSIVLFLLAATIPGAQAQSVPGMPGGTVGLPANPFASNYPSEPPTMDERRASSAAPHRRPRGSRRSARPEAAPIPPAAIPSR